MRYPLKHVPRYTNLRLKRYKFLPIFEKRRKLPLTIVRAKGALTASQRNGSLSRAAKTVTSNTVWTPNMGAIGEPCSDFSIP